MECDVYVGQSGDAGSSPAVTAKKKLCLTFFRYYSMQKGFWLLGRKGLPCCGASDLSVTSRASGRSGVVVRR